MNIPDNAIRRQIASAIDVVVQVSRLSDGTRKVISIAEITGMEGEVVTMQDIFVFRKRGIRETGEVLGEFVPTGIRPKFAERLAVTGIQLPASMFEVPRMLLRTRDGAFTRTPDICRCMRDRPFALDAGQRRRSAEHSVSPPHGVPCVRQRAARRSFARFVARSRRDAQQRSPAASPHDAVCPGPPGFSRLIEQAGMTIKPAKVLLLSGVLGFATFFDRRPFFSQSCALGALLGVAAGDRSLLR